MLSGYNITLVTSSRHCTSAGVCGQEIRTHVTLNYPFFSTATKGWWAKKASKSHLKQLTMKRKISPHVTITAKCWRWWITGIFSHRKINIITFNVSGTHLCCSWVIVITTGKGSKLCNTQTLNLISQLKKWHFMPAKINAFNSQSQVLDKTFQCHRSRHFLGSHDLVRFTWVQKRRGLRIGVSGSPWQRKDMI